MHQAGNEFEPKASAPTSGSGDFYLTTDIPIACVVEHLASCGVELIEGPVARTRAVGRSVYFRDPNGNLVEVSNYPRCGGE